MEFIYGRAVDTARLGGGHGHPSNAPPPPLPLPWADRGRSENRIPAAERATAATCQSEDHGVSLGYRGCLTSDPGALGGGYLPSLLPYLTSRVCESVRRLKKTKKKQPANVLKRIQRIHVVT